MVALNKSIVPLFGLLLLFACTMWGILSYLPETRLSAGFNSIFTTFENTTRHLLLLVGVVGSVGLVGGLVFAGFWTWEHWQQKSLDTQEKRIQIRRQQFVIESAPVNHQLWKIDVLANLAEPLHLAAGRVNGALIEPTEGQLTRWQKYQLMHATLKLPAQVFNQLEAPEPPKILEPILPVLVAAQRLILAGGSDSGKTCLAKHIISGRRDHSGIIIIDPHSPSKILGHDVIGAGRNYAAIGEALESLVLLMTSRYEDVKNGVLGYGEHARLSIFVDEWTSIAENCDNAGKMLKTLLTESRKVSIHLCFLVHSTTTDVLGVDAQIRKSAIIVELVGGNGQPHRGFIHPQSKLTLEGKKAIPQEYALPGPFPGYVSPPAQVITALPDAKVLKAQLLAGQGFSITSIAKEFYGVDKPNSRQIQEVKDLLERATEARQNHD